MSELPGAFELVHLVELAELELGILA